MPRTFAARIVAAWVSASLVATPVLAKSAESLRDLVGARGAGGQTQLEQRGFEHIRTEEEAGAKISYWWHAGRKDCIRVRTSDGRYTAIDDVANGDCDKKSSSSGVAVAAAAVGALAIGALLLSRKSKDRPKDDGYQQDWQHVEVHGTESGTLRIFRGPSTNDPVVNRVADGTILRNYGCDTYRQEIWCEVSGLDSRSTGWARDRYLRVTSARPGHYPSYPDAHRDLVEVHGVKSGMLKIMAGPSRGDTVVGRVREGSVLQRHECQYGGGENWCHVSTLDGRMYGWVRERFLRQSAGAGHYPSYGGGQAGSIAGIEGMDAVRAFDELRARGFENVDSFSSGNTVYGIYFYRPSRLCVQTASANSRIVDIRDILSHPQCR